MPKRIEFPRKIKAAIIERAMDDKGVVRCEACGGIAKRGEIDHILPAALGGDATLDNGQLLCHVCHKQKTAGDVRSIRKADRARDKSNGAFKKKGPAMPGTKRSGLRKKMDGSVEKRG